MSSGIEMNASDMEMYTVLDVIDVANATTSQPMVNIFSMYDNSSLLFLQEFCPLAMNVDKLATAIWYILGFSGNLVSAKIWLEKRMRVNNSSATYLAALSVSDLLFLLLHTLQESEYAWGHHTLNHPVLCESYFVFYLFFQYLSPILVLAFTCERWIAVCHPFVKERYCTTQRALRVLVLLVILSLSLASMQAYLWRYDPAEDRCMLRSEDHETEQVLWSVWTWSTEMLVFLVVPLVILIFNILVILEVRHLARSRQRMMLPPPSTKPPPRTEGITTLKGLTSGTPSGGSEGGSTSRSGYGTGTTSAATTVMLLSVSFYVIVTVLPATIVYSIYNQFPPGNEHLTVEQIRSDPTWNRYFGYVTIRKIVDEICISHYACNIFLYILTGPQFRRSLQRQIQRVIPKTLLKDDSFATFNSAGSHKTSIRNIYTSVNGNGIRNTTKL